MLPYGIIPYDNETPNEQALCLEYLQLGKDRSVKKLVQRGLAGNRQMDEVQELFLMYDWDERAKIYDGHHYNEREQVLLTRTKKEVVKWQPMGYEEAEGRLARIARFEMPITMSGVNENGDLHLTIDLQAVLRDHPYMIKGERQGKSGTETMLHSSLDALKIIYNRHLEEAKQLRAMQGGQPEPPQLLQADRTSLMFELIETLGEDEAVKVFDKIEHLIEQKEA